MVSCAHVTVAERINLNNLLNHKDLICADCDSRGPNLWICLYKDCLRIGCAEKSNDHSTLHNNNHPTHCVHMNMSSKRIWCYECKKEVFMDYTNMDSDQDIEIKSKDSGHGSYSTLRTNTPEKIVHNERDTESSDEDDEYNIQIQERPSGLVGLQNIGNTCYMNAALQALSNTEPLTKFFLDCSYVVQLLSDGKKPGLSRTYQALIRDIWVKNNQGYVTPSGILYGIRSVHNMFRGYQQHDTQEFLRNFMDQLHEELKQIDFTTNLISSSPDVDTYSLAMEELGYESSDCEYETCDSGVSERSSLSDDADAVKTTKRSEEAEPVKTTKRRLSRCSSPNRRQRQRMIIDTQPTLQTNNKKQIKYRSIISDIFDGKLLSSVQCLTCDRISSRIETFQDLSLPIPSKDHLVVLHGRTSNSANTCSESLLPVAQDNWITWILSWLKSWFYGPTVTLPDCLAAFFSTDELKGDNMYSCEKCNKLRNGIKYNKVLQLPEVLCIHLKRFRHELMFSSKISSIVSFPLKGLDMKPYLHNDCISKVSSYELFSVICHHGTAGGGHYTCFALNSSQWYEFDDQYVTKVSSDKVQNCEAYVLFYQKTNTPAERIRSKTEDLIEKVNKNPSMIRTYISRQWVNRFYYCSEPGPIDNSDFLCQHGSVHPDRNLDLNKVAMVVPKEVYDYLYNKFGGCLPFSDIKVCPACSALQNRLLSEMEAFLRVSREAQSQDSPHTHYLSSSWYTQWHNFVQKRSQEPPGPIDNSKINLEQLDIKEAAEIPESLWNFFYNIYGGGPEVRIRPPEAAYSEKVESEDDFCSAKSSKHQSSTAPDKKIDSKSIHSHGEPMETQENQVMVNGDDAKDEVDDDNGDVTITAVTVENGESPETNDVNEDECDKEVTEYEKKGHRRHYRRRRKY